MDERRYVDRSRLQWVGSAIALVLVAMVLGMFSFWKDSVLEDQTHDEKIEDILIRSVEDMKSTREIHDKDIQYIHDDIDEIKRKQQILMDDIKLLLKEK